MLATETLHQITEAQFRKYLVLNIFEIFDNRVVIITELTLSLVRMKCDLRPLHGSDENFSPGKSRLSNASEQEVGWFT